jgi:hypothetical protein
VSELEERGADRTEERATSHEGRGRLKVPRVASGRHAMSGQHGEPMSSDPVMTVIVLALLVLLVIVLILAA